MVGLEGGGLDLLIVGDVNLYHKFQFPQCNHSFQFRYELYLCRRNIYSEQRLLMMMIARYRAKIAGKKKSLGTGIEPEGFTPSLKERDVATIVNRTRTSTLEGWNPNHWTIEATILQW